MTGPGLVTTEEANEAVKQAVARAGAAGRLAGGLNLLDRLADALAEGESYDADRLRSIAQQMREQAA